MLQRSPTYVVSRPEKDAIANFLRRMPALHVGLQAQPLEKHRVHDAIFYQLAQR